MELRPRPLEIAAGVRIDHPVAFVHDAAFRDHTDTIDIIGEGRCLPLKTGEASNRLFREAYEKVFVQLRESTGKSETYGCDSEYVLQPDPVELLYFYSRAEDVRGSAYAQANFAFKLKDGNGATIAAWIVRGDGAFDRDAFAKKASAERLEGEGDVVLLAIESAVRQFVRSFELVPELIAWRRGEAMQGPASMEQQTETLPNGSGYAATYPGMLRMQVTRAVPPDPPTYMHESPSSKRHGLLAVRVLLRNDSPRRLALDPAEITWARGLETRRTLSPLVTAALSSARPYGLAVRCGRTAGEVAGSLVLQAAAFVVWPVVVAAAVGIAASVPVRREEFKRWKAALDGALFPDTVLDPGAEKEGLVVFAGAPPEGELIIPVVDIDAALRYRVRVPFPGQ
jgi:hypothetical protein